MSACRLRDHHCQPRRPGSGHSAQPSQGAERAQCQLIAEVLDVCQAADADEGVGCILIKGSEKAFAAGADISEMADKDNDIYGVNPFGEWDKIAATWTPMSQRSPALRWGAAASWR